MAEAIKIDGLAEFSRNLKRLDAELPKALRVAMNEAADIVVQAARAKVPRRTGRAARSIRPQSTRTLVRVAAGGKRVPYYPWLDFGGRVGRAPSTRRTFYSDGRFIYPAYYANRDRFTKVLEQALVEVARQSGVEVT